MAGLTEPTYRRTAANSLCRWAVQELVEIAVRNDMSLGKLLTCDVPWKREPRRSVSMILSPSGTRLRRKSGGNVLTRQCSVFNPDGLHDIVGTQCMYCCLPGFVASVVRRIQYEGPAVLEFCPHVRGPMPVSCIRRHPGCADAAVDVLKDTVQPGSVCFVVFVGVLNNQWMPCTPLFFGHDMSEGGATPRCSLA